MFLYQKQIDRSTLRQGFQIPVEYHYLLKMIPGGMPGHGETRNIKVIIDGVEYDAQLKNQGFDRNKYDAHAEVVQIRYIEGSDLVKRLREVFSSTCNYVESIKNLPENINRKFTIRIPEEYQEFLALSTTDLPNVFVADCITTAIKAEVKNEISKQSELDFETLEFREDKNASIKEITRLQKVRQLDRSIGDSLKQLYDYRCQMSGEQIGEPYGAMVVEAHHIIPFTESMNNDTSNIIILSPNYHRIIHKTKAEFDKERLAFIFPNGLIDKVRLNKHLF
jgi:predicted HNH restriction endonuclease